MTRLRDLNISRILHSSTSISSDADRRVELHQQNIRVRRGELTPTSYVQYKRRGMNRSGNKLRSVCGVPVIQRRNSIEVGFQDNTIVEQAVEFHEWTSSITNNVKIIIIINQIVEHHNTITFITAKCLKDCLRTSSHIPFGKEGARIILPYGKQIRVVNYSLYKSHVLRKRCHLILHPRYRRLTIHEPKVRASD